MRYSQRPPATRWHRSPLGSRAPRIMLVCVALLTLVCATSAHAWIQSVTVTPAQPTDTDTIVIEVSGWFNDGCWGVDPVAFENPGLSFNYDVYATDAYMPGYGCLTVIVPYQRTDTVGPLPPGYYTVSVAEHHESIRDPNDRFESVSFQIGPCDCPSQGDFDGDQQVTSLDLSRMIDVLFAGAANERAATCPCPQADFDCDKYSTAFDLSGLIDYLFAGGAGPCDPCAK